MAEVQVPKVTGLTQSAAEDQLKTAGLVSAVSNAADPSVPKGNIISSDPKEGASVPTGSKVTLQVSSGPAVTSAAPAAAPSKVKVPDVSGLNETAAAVLLQDKELKCAKDISREYDSTTPKGGVIKSVPPADSVVESGSTVSLVVSKGTGVNWQQWVIGVALVLLALAILGIIMYGMFGGTFLTSLAKPEVARGLITFLIALTTVGIALILAISTMLLDGDAAEDAARFDRGKQVLTALIGILGTIVGFYYGSASKPTPADLTVTTSSLHDGKANTAYTAVALQATGGTPPLKWSVKPPLPAGLTLADDGTLSGTPTAASAKAPYTFTVTDSETPPVSKTAQIDLTVTP